MSKTKGVLFHVVRHFDIVGGGTGVLLKNVRSPAGQEVFYVANINDLKSATIGEYFEIACRIKGDAIQIPNELIQAWIGPSEKARLDKQISNMVAMADVTKQIRWQYLAHLYNGPLHASRQQAAVLTSRRVEKSFDSKDVFAHPILRMLESLHDVLQPVKLHEAMVENSYQFNRHAIYTRFRDDPEGISYKTPRSLNYYPLENMVRVAYALGGVPDDIEVRVKEDKVEKIKAYPVMVNIVRTFRNEGWTSLRDLAYNEPPLREFIRMFYDNGYGKPEITEQPGK
jgi:hypothetical protein